MCFFPCKLLGLQYLFSSCMQSILEFQNLLKESCLEANFPPAWLQLQPSLSLLVTKCRTASLKTNKKKLVSAACSDFYVLSHFPATLPLFLSVIRLIVISSVILFIFSVLCIPMALHKELFKCVYVNNNKHRRDCSMSGAILQYPIKRTDFQ